MDKYKITDSELESGVVAAPNILNDTPQENKSVFDRLPRLIATKMNGFIDSVISKFADYYNKTEIDSKETALSDRINAKANSADVYAKSETYTKAETDIKFDAKANASDVYTKAQTYTKEETNVAINEKVNELGAGDMAKAVYDTDGDGVVDDAEKLNGQPASYYATKTEVETAQSTADTAKANAANAQTTADNAITRLDNMGVDLLWTNASPTSPFAPQTINISTDGYKYFITACITDGANPTPIAFDVFIKGYEGEMRHIYTSSRFRSVKFTSGKATFKTGYVATGNGYANENGIVIPLYIWGVK